MSEEKRIDRLGRIVEEKEREVAALLPREAGMLADAEAMPPTRPFAAALRSPEEVRLLAEIKRRSPSAGDIRKGAEPTSVAEAYRAGGAAAISVLTDGPFFGGSLDDLTRVRTAVELPLLRKDFVIAPVQISEARIAGADAILLIVRILDDAQLADLSAFARALDLDVLVEVHDAGELDRALAVGATLIGINNRDLSTFQTDIALSLGLAATVDPAVTLVGESGIRTGEDVRRLGAAGVDAVLVGESLMRQPELEAAARALTGHRKDPGARRG